MSRLIVALSRAKARIKSASIYFGFRYELQRVVVQDLSLFLLHLTLLLLKSYFTKYRRKNCESIRFVLFCLKQFLFEIFKKSQKLPLIQNLTQKCFQLVYPKAEVVSSIERWRRSRISTKLIFQKPLVLQCLFLCQKMQQLNFPLTMTTTFCCILVRKPA